MNFYSAGPSAISSSSSSFSSSSSDDMEEEEVIVQTIENNNRILAEYQRRRRNAQPTHGGSVLGHRTINRDREGAAKNLIRDYFSENPTFNEDQFRRRFRMSRSLFLRIVDVVQSHDQYFMQRRDATGKLGLSTLQKITTFRILVYVVPADATDEYIKIGESTAIKCVKKFCRAIVEIFGGEYLRSSTANDVARLLYIGEQRGFPGILRSLDCMHWKWKNCPIAWAERYSGPSGYPTIILEIVADYDLWIWHAYFGMPGSNNDINILETSHIFSDLARGIAPPANYVIQGKEFNMEYYLADEIYPKWAALVQTIYAPTGPKKQYFVMKQEACRKDVERAFEVLQSQFAIVANPAHYWRKNDLKDIMTACIIMHNMIIEDEREFDASIDETREVSL